MNDDEWHKTGFASQLLKPWNSIPGNFWSISGHTGCHAHGALRTSCWACWQANGLCKQATNMAGREPTHVAVCTNHEPLQQRCIGSFKWLDVTHTHTNTLHNGEYVGTGANKRKMKIASKWGLVYDTISSKCFFNFLHPRHIPWRDQMQNRRSPLHWTPWFIYTRYFNAQDHIFS